MSHKDLTTKDTKEFTKAHKDMLTDIQTPSVPL